MAEEKVNRNELRQRRLQVSNVNKEIFVERERNEDSEIDCEYLLERLLDTEKEATELSDKT